MPTFDYPDGTFAQGSCSMVECLETTASIGSERAWIELDAGFWYASRMSINSRGKDGPTSEVIEVEREGHGYTPMLRAVTSAMLAGETEHPIHTMDACAEVFDLLDEIRRCVPVGR